LLKNWASKLFDQNIIKLIENRTRQEDAHSVIDDPFISAILNADALGDTALVERALKDLKLRLLLSDQVAPNTQTNIYSTLQKLMRDEQNKFGYLITYLFDDTHLRIYSKLQPLVCNLRYCEIQYISDSPNNLLMDYQSARTLKDMSAFFPCFDSENKRTSLMIRTNRETFIINEKNLFLYGLYFLGVANPDRTWSILEKAWGSISETQPAYFQAAIHDLMDKIHTGDIADSGTIAQAIQADKPISWLMLLPGHIVSMSIHQDTCILTNLGGSLNLKTGETDGNPLTGKRIMRLRPEDKTLWTPDFIQSLQTAQPDAIRQIFQLPLIGLIQYKGQKRSNCAGTHPKSIWEDQLLYAHIQHLAHDNPEKPVSAYFQDIFPLDQALPAIIQHRDLIKSHLKPAFEAFKTLTLTARQQVLASFQADDHASDFLADQFLLGLRKVKAGVKTVITEKEAQIEAKHSMSRLIGTAKATIRKMQDNLDHLDD